MSFLQTNRNRRRSGRFGYPILFFAVLVIVMNFAAPNASRSFLRGVAVPFLRVRDSVSGALSGVFSYFRSKSSLADENARLAAVLQETRLKLLSSEAKAAEYEEIERVFGTAAGRNKLIVSVLMRPPRSPFDVLMLDAGSEDGLAEGAIVYAAGGIPIGTVSSLSKKSSEATLYSSPGRRTQAVIQGPRIATEAVGRGGGNFAIVLPRELKVEKGVAVLLPGNDNGILGYIDDIELDPIDTFQTILLRTPVNINSQTWVMVDKI